MTGEKTTARGPANQPGQHEAGGPPPAGVRTPTTIDRLSDEFVGRLAQLSPLTATALGIPGHDHRIDDLSPAGLAALDELVQITVAALTAAESEGGHDDLARAVLLERLLLDADRYRSGWAHANLNVIESPLQHVRMVFDLMPRDTPAEQATFVLRMRAVPAALLGYRESLLLAAERGQVAAQRQIDKCAEQCAAFAGSTDQAGFFSASVRSFPGGDGASGELDSAAHAAETAFAELGHFLTERLRPFAPAVDAVGAERYALASREFLGATVDLVQTYEWGWQEFLAIETELHAVAERVAPGLGVQAAAAVLDADPAYLVRGTDGLRSWMQRLSDRAVEELGRSHFDIPAPIRALDCRIAPPGGGVGAYYTPPSDDFSRPGSMWWSVEAGRTEFTTWRETTTVYHEGVPGHHLQLATAVYQRDQLNDYQRLLAGTSGHAEGWALYAERLVRELGYLTDDGDLLGLLDSQLFRAARVVLDIGMHLELEIPAGTGFHEGETWTPDLGLEFLLTRTLSDPAHCRDEIDRYLGWPGQAPSYKLGERVWLEGRDAARARHSASGENIGPFDEKAFHTTALNLGGMGLDLLAQELGRL